MDNIEEKIKNLVSTERKYRDKVHYEDMKAIKLSFLIALICLFISIAIHFI